MTTPPLYNNTQRATRKEWTRALAVRITKPVAGGRPTTDPKGSLIAVRLSARQVQALARRSRRDGIGLSEAVRRCVDDWAATQRRTPPAPPSTRATRDRAPRSAK